MTVKFLRRPEVEGITGLSRSSIYDMMARDEFPRPVSIGKRAVAWRDDEISDWMKERTASAA
ncbi:helix-turn-helix transcriptional regulator [Pseudooceanicola sp. MF1-13]|uniref:helix-turn-helix transcriptional regulator n=1 Tax=Pseudooceanicola sp. MF1-13 TaxID=3379095 RepID=UPI0038922855